MQDSRSKDPHRDAVTMTANCHRRRSRLHTYAVAICLAAMLPLVGCTSTPTDPSSSASALETSSPATTTATSTSTAEQPTPPPTSAAVYKPATADGPAQNVPVPVLPEKAKEFSKEGLLAFAEHWYSTLGYAFETGDSGPMMEISEPSCGTCSSVGDMVSKWHATGGWISGGLMTVHSTTSSFNETPEGSYQAILLIQQSAVTYFNADSSLSKALPPQPSRADIVVAKYLDNQWSALKAEHFTQR